MRETYRMRQISGSVDVKCIHHAHGECVDDGEPRYAFFGAASGKMGAPYCRLHALRKRRQKLTEFEERFGRCAVCGDPDGSFTDHSVADLLPD